ncbi:MAG: HipA N-terminal domain-containing protein [bacterium]
MSRSGRVYCYGIPAGLIEETPDGFRFAYDTAYLSSAGTRSISLTLTKRLEPYTSRLLFPFFFGLLAEGILKETQCRKLKLDENDHFGRLLKTAHCDTIGAVTVIEEPERR